MKDPKRELGKLKSKKSFFVVLEGLDGSGKTTQLNKLKDLLDIIVTKEPTDGYLGNVIKDIYNLKKPVAPITKALLLVADRKEHVDSLIKPAMASGKGVISDRFHASTLAYQCYAEGASLELVQHISKRLLDGFEPDLYFFFDIPPEVSYERLSSRRKKDAIEQKDVDFFKKVYEGYLFQIAKDPDKWVKVDALDPIEKITTAIISELISRGFVENG